MGSGNDSILDMYLYETNTLLEQLDGILLAAEQADTFSQDSVNEIFRIMHTVKGSSAMMEFSSLMTVAHRIEDLFFVIREKTIEVVPEQLRPELFDIVFQAVDFFRGEIEKVENGEPLSQSIDSIVNKINSYIDKIQGNAPAEPAPAPAAQEKAEEAAPAAPAGAALSAVNPDYRFGVQVFFDEGSGMENLRAFMLLSSIRDFCTDFVASPENVENDPSTSEIIADQGFVVWFRTAGERDAAVGAATTTGSVRAYQTVEAKSEPAPEEIKAPVEEKSAAAEAPKAAAAAPAVAKAPQHATKESLISVSLGKLDQLMAVVSEIVITESMVTASPDLKGLRLDNFSKSARELRKLTDDLQDVSMSLRMVPVSNTFQKMNRIVRDMSKKLGKRAKLTLIGEDTEVDKTIVDGISDPIMHIVRNSMDHGLEETEADRIAAGKDPVGEITLAARHTGSEVIIEIRDDGKGADTKAILNKAIRQGLADPDHEYSQKDILNFMMMPGFSTNTEVTEFSGRGVGMDVVKKNVADVGGTVSITSEWGKGMTTTLKIPLTMAIMDGMEVSVGESLFTIPINNILSSMKVGAGDIIHDPAQGEMLKIRDNFYHVLRAKDIFQLEDGRENVEEGILIWVEAGEHSYCLFVDELLGEQQIVVKPLPNFVNNFGIKNYGITGCSILGDGSISIILDIANLYTAVENVY
ncbi:MAG: chemotaxis protein CheA [Oscillospiraceae bacterium]|jgi:two-component system chemotaxis sensor kinase CheA|nr:chemotaxis protein CheA [Oscillospiraceae bacterium]MCI9587687.1 chemotaxis protein CheA [Oscillospiraceae bacterium]